jgi:hypothetical protein
MKMSFVDKKPDNSKHYVEVNDVAQYFSVSTATVRVWVHKKYIPRSSYIKAGDTYRYNIASIEAHLTEEGEETHGERTISD